MPICQVLSIIPNTYARMEYETRLAVEREREVVDTVREKLFPRIAASALAGPESGVYRATPEQIGRVHDGLLLNGNVEACAGIGMAHEFLSAERVRRMPNLFGTVSRIARRGRKRWLGLALVSQHPQHLPDELLGLLNGYVVHRLNDANTIGRLRRSIGGD